MMITKGEVSNGEFLALSGQGIASLETDLVIFRQSTPKQYPKIKLE